MENKINTGGPAFPVQYSNEADGPTVMPSEGMTLRDYFIAHAPAEPQPWFEPIMPPKPSLAVWVGDSGMKYDNRQAAYEREGSECVRPVNEAAHDAWLVEQAKQRYIQWPAAWADEMLKAREVSQ